MGRIGFEPITSELKAPCAKPLRQRPGVTEFGDSERIRTVTTLLDRQLHYRYATEPFNWIPFLSFKIKWFEMF